MQRVSQAAVIYYEAPPALTESTAQPEHSPTASSTPEEVTSTDIPSTTRRATTTQAYEPETEEPDAIRTVPFYSQFADISDSTWKKVSCGVASLAMLIDYYAPAVDPDTLLNEGIANGAYIESAGWSHAGLISLAKARGLTGETVSLSHLSMTEAFSALETAVEEGPVMVSVHYTFEPTNPIPHLAVITDIQGDTVYYNDPAEKLGGGSLSSEKFKRAWKKRYIEIRPVK